MSMEKESRLSHKPVSGDLVSGIRIGNIQSTNSPNSTRDRLSELPDLAIVHILSCLYFEEAARTSVLSKRFKSLWYSASSLNFSDKHCDKKGRDFISFVNEALGFHQRSEIEKFFVKFRYDYRYFKVVDGWIKFAVQKQVKLLHLNLAQNYRDLEDDEHILPDFLYNNERLVELVISSCEIWTKGIISWSSLKLLSICKTRLDKGLISRILSGCPVLETLELISWTGFDQLKISSLSLRVLRIVSERYSEPEGDCLYISGPNLESLEVSGYLHRPMVQVNDVGSLVSATMSFEIRPHPMTGSNIVVREVLESLSHVKELTVGEWCIKALSTWESYKLSSTWSGLKHLTLYVRYCKWDHGGITRLLRSSPYLETLVIRLSDRFYGERERNTHACYSARDQEYYWKSESRVYKWLWHLKTVKVLLDIIHDPWEVSCEAMKSLFVFLQFLLRNARVLEEIVIESSTQVPRRVVADALKLLSSPAASPDAVVHLKPPHFWIKNPRYEYQYRLLFGPRGINSEGRVHPEVSSKVGRIPQTYKVYTSLTQGSLQLL